MPYTLPKIGDQIRIHAGSDHLLNEGTIATIIAMHDRPTPRTAEIRMTKEIQLTNPRIQSKTRFIIPKCYTLIPQTSNKTIKELIHNET